jgi:hypothetical protein
MRKTIFLSFKSNRLKNLDRITGLKIDNKKKLVILKEIVKES